MGIITIERRAFEACLTLPIGAQIRLKTDDLDNALPFSFAEKIQYGLTMGLILSQTESAVRMGTDCRLARCCAPNNLKFTDGDEVLASLSRLITYEIGNAVKMLSPAGFNLRVAFRTI
jgi:hypothetical protein